MATETEKKFFKAFGISLKIEKGCTPGITQTVIPLIYPEITDILRKRSRLFKTRSNFYPLLYR